MTRLARLLLERMGAVRRPRVGPPPAGARAERAGWTASDWARVRAPQRHRDAQLSQKAMRWLARLPRDMRPLALARGFPRIVNRMAALWRDEGLTEYLFNDLLEDRRGGRQGFPPAVQEEIEALYELHGWRVDACARGADAWAATTTT